MEEVWLWVERASRWCKSDSDVPFGDRGLGIEATSCDMRTPTVTQLELCNKHCATDY
jgi:hypothetical protein